MAVAHVQTIKTHSNSVSPTYDSGNITVSAGNLLLCAVIARNSSVAPSISSVQLNGSTAFTQDANQSDGGFFDDTVYLYRLENVSAGTHFVRVTFAAQQAGCCVYVTEVSGAATSSALDATSIGTNGSGTAVATGNRTVTASDDFFYAVTTTRSTANPATITGAGSFTIPTNGSELNGAANFPTAVGYRANPGTTTLNGQFTIDSSNWVAAAAAYKAAAGGGGGATVSKLAALGVG